ncbi:hypothetical protein AC578_9868 [Pseudocercospora eumusae]|uniref:Uncharacterized protein n=1 Tax=Pseudocercospora eumusae TaxID=321146 RepID=A0A139HB66_9PEZI|nr:hypothetical protein AC578_9868 [Pseudocercospora eumusae]
MSMMLMFIPSLHLADLDAAITGLLARSLSTLKALGMVNSSTIEIAVMNIPGLDKSKEAVKASALSTTAIDTLETFATDIKKST